MRSRLVTTGIVFSGLLGGASGVLCSHLFSRDDDSHKQVEKTNSGGTRDERQRESPSDLDALDGRVRSMERRLARFSESERLKEPPIDNSEPLSDEDVAREEMRQEGGSPIEAEHMLEEEIWNIHVEDFEEEPIDPEWARRMEADVTASYQNLIRGADGGGSIESITCRQSRCKMEMRWTTNTAMNRQSKAALHDTNEIARRCIRHLNRNIGDNRAVLMFECSDPALQQG